MTASSQANRLSAIVSHMEQAHSFIDPTIEKDSIVLITGANGYIASHCVDQFLKAGYRVRGTVRSIEKAKWMYEVFDEKYGKGRFEAVVVENMAADGAFNEAVKGVSGVCHAASVLTFSPNPDEVIPDVVKGALNALTAATTEPMIRSFVYTSSSTACTLPVSNKHVKITKDTWNDEAIEIIKTKPTPFTVYAASKTEAERAIWKAVEASKPPFQVASVLPNANFGPIIKPAGNGMSSTAGYILLALKGGKPELQPQWFVDVRDTARLHVIAMINRSCNGERLFAFSAPFNNNDIYQVLREQYPDNDKILADQPDLGKDITEIPNQEAEALLQKHYGRGFIPFAESVRATTDPSLA